MSVDFQTLSTLPRLLFSIPLAPLQGSRFQPTGFPSLGAATFQTSEGTSLLVESAQSMANRLEMTIWDEASQDVIETVKGISHVKVMREGKFLTDTILEAHRLNSPYLLVESSKAFFNLLKEELGGLETRPINRRILAETLLKFDIGSLLHGVFLAKKELAGGRLRIARAISAFIEADGAKVAASGGVKNDHVNPSGDTKAGFGNVPFARDEFTADTITLYVNIDLAQIRGYGLGKDVEELLIALALFKLRRLLSSNLRLRTACDLKATPTTIEASEPKGFVLPTESDLATLVKEKIQATKDKMKVSEAKYDEPMKKGKEEPEDKPSDDRSENHED
jgi:CRISPR-associated protein Csb1